MTGAEATFGTQLKNGAETAVADINAAGGVLGKKLGSEVGDDACDPKQARAVAREIRRHEAAVRGRALLLVVVDPGLGGLCRRRRAADHPGLDQSASSPIAGLWNTFRVCGRDDQQGDGRRRLRRQEFQGQERRHPPRQDTYGKGLADEIKKALNKAGVKEKLYEAYNKGDKDFTALVSKMKAANIDVVYVGGYHTEAGLIVRQMRDQGMKTMMIVGRRPGHQRVLAPSPARPAKACCSPSARSAQAPTAAAIVKKFKDKGVDPEGYMLYTYAAMQMWAQAATKANTTDPQKVAEAIAAAPGTRCSARSTYDKKGDITTVDYVSVDGARTASTTRSPPPRPRTPTLRH